ncbi:MAG TPA: SDR family oxidoreductase [Oscillatoriaceae cyanobacterium]
MSDSAKQHGAAVNPNPLSEKPAAHPAQHQEWPGLDSKMQPQPDHGEQTYVGSNKLLGKRALITGGDSGMGRAIAIAFAREGADVAIAYYDEHSDAQETMRWVREAGRRGLAISGDLAQRSHCREVVRQAVEELGGLDILVNHAGRQYSEESIADLTPEVLERTFSTNLYGYVWTAQAALEHMQAGAVIINTGSVTGLRGNPHLLSYAASKGAIHNFTQSLAHQLAERGIRVNCVAPGPVWTPLVVSTMPAEHVPDFGKQTMWHRPAEPAEIAPSYVYLASADSRFMTGEILAITGEQTSR